MNEVRVIITYELYSQSGEWLAAQNYVVPLEIDDDGMLTIPLADEGAIIAFGRIVTEGDEKIYGRVVERHGKGADWYVKCEQTEWTGRTTDGHPT